MKTFFMRHGETNYNILRLCNDDPKREVRLTEKGISQAEDAANQLKTLPIERIIVSELPRTRQTAEIVNQYHQAPITSHQALNDIHSGFDGRPVEDYQRAIAGDPLTVRPPGGESLLEHKQRVLGFLAWLKQQQEGPILVVAHEETLRVVIAYFRGLSDYEMMPLRIGNCEILSFDL